jgi:hypothetical protein
MRENPLKSTKPEQKKQQKGHNSKHIKTSAKKKTLPIVKVSAMYKQTGI